MEYPEDLLYSKEHEWLRVDENGKTGTIGITAFAQSELGDIVYVEIETLNQRLERNDLFGTVEAVKTVSDLYIPVGGTVVAINEKLQDAPELVNEDPYNHGWMIRINIEDEIGEADLMTASEYTKMVGV